MKSRLLIIPLAIALGVCALSQVQSRRAITSPGVYFFGPSLEEQSDSTEEVDEALNDFGYYTSSVQSFLRRHKLATDYYSERILICDTSVRQIVVFRDSVDFGTILIDGKKRPKLLPYVHTDSDLESEFRKYFAIK